MSSRLFSLSCLLLVSPAFSLAQAPNAADLSTRLASLEKALEIKRTEAHAPGVALVIIKDDQIIYVKGLGYKDLESKAPITSDTLFAIGSSTKAFTALTVMMSKDDGKLQLSDAPRKYVPYFSLQDPDADAKITIGDLLCHKSGLDRTDLFWYSGKLNKKEIIENLKNCKPTAKLGAKFQYQNVMFLSAGEVVANAQKQSWESFLKKRVFDPLGMKSSTLSIRKMADSSDHATGYSTSGDPKMDRKMPYHDINAIAPAGAINSNLKDMAQWVRFMLNRGTVNGKRLVSEASFDEIIAPHMTIVPKIDYGYGWFLRDWHGHKVIEHGGNIDGFTTAVALMPDQRLGFVMLCNQNNSVVPPSSLEIVWKNLVSLPDTESKPEPPAVSTVKPEAEVGEYTYEDKLTIAITHKEGKLTATLAGQPPYPLLPVGGRKYKLGDPAPDGFSLTFRPNVKDPKVAEVFLEQPGIKLALTRKSDIKEPEYKSALTAEELENKVVEALGGEAALKSHASQVIKVSVLMETQGINGTGTITAKAPNLASEQFDFFALKKRIFSNREWTNGKASGDESSLLPTEPRTGKALANALIAAEFNEPLHWKMLYKTVVIKGEDKVGDEKVYVIVKTPANGDPITDYISMKTFFIIKRDTISGDGATATPLTETFSDYRNLEGVFVPFRTVRKSPATEAIVTVEKVEWNPKVKESVFQKRR